MKFISMIFSFLLFTSVHAQDIGVQVGIHSTKATADGASESAELGYKVGVMGVFDLTENVYFRTGLLYTTRNFTLTDATPRDFDYEFSYLDVPVLFQMQINPMFAVFAGGVVAINMDKKVKVPSLNSSGDADDVKSLYLLAQVGGQFMFDGIGFDVYFERGLGEFVGDDGGTQSARKAYTSIGANFIYLF